MPKYFRQLSVNRKTDENTGRGFGRYTVYSDKTEPYTYPWDEPGDDPTEVYNRGELVVRNFPGKTIPHFGDHGDELTLDNPLAKALGIHPALLEKIENEEWEKGDQGIGPDIAFHSDPRFTQKEDDPRGIGLAKTVSKLRNDPRANPDTLFSSTPGKLKIQEAFFDPSLTSSVTTAIGIAQNDFPNSEIVPSDDLSDFSSKLVQNAQSRGLITPNPDNPTGEATNTLTQERMITGANVLNGYLDRFNGNLNNDNIRIPQAQVDAGRETVREMLRGPRKRNTQPVTSKGLSDQFVIPGMEGYLK